MTQPPPIVPGPGEPQWYQEQQPASPPYQQGPYPPPPAQYPPPQVVYVQPQQPKGDTVGKAALGTVTVVGVLILIFCVLPVVLCFSLGMAGMITNPGPGPTP